MFNFGREVCNDLPNAEKREWLITNGIGGYGMGTIAGVLTRRYHGLLIAALHPPLGRTLLLAKLDETVVSDGHMYPLHTNRWANGVIDPHGFHHLECFHLEGTTPVWTFTCADALLEKRVWMQPGANTTYIRYDLRRATRSLVLTLKAIINYRDYHSTTHADGWQMQIVPVETGLQITAFDGATPFYLLSDQAEATPQHNWYRNFHLSLEAYRGLDAMEDHLHAGAFRIVLHPGRSFTLVASTEAQPKLDGISAYAERQAYEQPLVAPVTSNLNTPAWLQHLTLAADQFIVRRPSSGTSDGHTIIAGYPWFGDWGRDTMIALPGLTLDTGRPEIAGSILKTFANFVDQGMLPNRFPDAGQEPEYNTVDATLWYFEALWAYHQATGDNNLIKELYPILQDIISWYHRGTRYNIHVDPEDGLVYAGEEGAQLTWMDAKVGDWVVTPRIGKPVEVNALWHNALQIMASLSTLLRKTKAAKQYKKQAEFVADNFRRRFWFKAGGYLYDVIDSPAGNLGPDGKHYDSSLRPNQILAVSLPFQLLSNKQAKAIVDVCTRHLLTPHGLRSLAADNPAYVGHYGGDPHQRDGAYHQGTVWSWLMGSFISAHLQVYHDPVLAYSFAEPLIRHLRSNMVGHLSEIFDGDPPFAARGCPAQAWSVAQLMQIWYKLELPGS